MWHCLACGIASVDLLTPNVEWPLQISAVAKSSPVVIESVAKEWVPLMLAYVDSRTYSVEPGGGQGAAVRGGEALHLIYLHPLASLAYSYQMALSQ